MKIEFDMKLLKASRTAILVVAIATLVAVLSVSYLSVLSSVENIVRDIRVAALSPPVPQSKEIVVVGLTEETVSQFTYRSPVDRKFLADLITTLENKGVREIGIDVLLDQPTEADKDELLRKKIRETKTPLFISYSNSDNVVNEDQLAYLNDFVPERLRAGANLSTDPFDGTVRWIFAGETNPGMPLGFGRKAVALLGIETPNEEPEIAWRPRPDPDTPPFAMYPAHTIEFLPDEWFTDKIVLVGAIQSITDRHRTPLAVWDDGEDAMMAGILVQAHGVSQYLEGTTSNRLSPVTEIIVTLMFAVIGVGIGLLKKGPVFSFSAGGAILLAYWLLNAFGYTYGVPLLPLMAPTIALLMALWLVDVIIGRSERKQREFIQGAFSRYVSPAVVDLLVDDPEALSISGMRREATFIFTDIASFTTLSEGLSSEDLSEVLNAYLDGACQIILKYQGTVDKFIGDAVMAIFNAPLTQADHAERAIKCALELDLYAEKFKKEKNAQGIPIGVTRIGVHTGIATVGNFGSSSRMDFTALGDTVNTAARTEGVNKYFGTRICVTEETVKLCPDFTFRPIGDVVLKGKEKAVVLYSPIQDTVEQTKITGEYMTAYEQLKDEKPEGIAAFQVLRAQYPDDPIIAYHGRRIDEGATSTLIILGDK